ncbi:MAG TPA: hypothetical protein VK623_12790 [Flavobacterium sp.]|nr:hypothetical protein [Flavobacterium sp.]
MKINKLFLAALAGGLFFASCDSNDDNEAPLGSYDNGFLVLNEGGTGEVTYISNDLQTVQQDVFNVVNGDAHDLGTYTQSIFFDGDRAFVISNGSNKITVVNRYTFEYIATIDTGMVVPRYGVAYNGKAYVTNLNTFGSATDDFITVINLATLAVEDPIVVNTYADHIVAEGGNLYVAGGSFGSGDKVTVINAATKTIVTAITVGESPNSMEERNGILYVLCGSFAADSKVVRIDTDDNTIIDDVTFPNTMGNAQNLDIEDGKIYFSVGPKVYKIATNAETVTDTPLFDTESTSGYIGYGFAVNGNKVYISEAADDFSSDGKIFIYSTAGAFIDNITVGLGPNGFYFN